MKTFIIGILKRFTEPSSYAGLGVLLAGLGLHVPGEVLQPTVLVLSGLAGVVAFFLKEKSTPEA